MSWIYDAMLYSYTLSLLFIFAEIFGHNHRRQMGTGLLTVVWVLQTLFFFMRMKQVGYFPIYTLFETFFFFSWGVVSFALVTRIFFRLEFFLFFVNLLGFSMVVFNRFANHAPRTGSEVHALANNLLIIHITFSVIGFVAFTVSAVFAGMYVFLYRKLKGKQWSRALRQIPALEKMGRYMYASSVWGIIFYFLGLAIGTIELDHLLQFLLDPKMLLSFAILFMYLLYVWQKLVFKKPGHELAWYNLAAFIVVIINGVISNLFLGFHWWGWPF